MNQERNAPITRTEDPLHTHKSTVAARSAISAAPPPNNLPAPLTTMVGRQAESQHIYDRLLNPSCRLLTIVGPGGAGKTRLALEVGFRILNSHAAALQFPDGLIWTSLADVERIEQAPGALAKALGFQFSPDTDATLQLVSSLRNRKLLLLVDNLEHLVAGSALWLTILQAAPGVKILATSRERLHLDGEWLVELEGLPTPASVHETGFSRYPAIELFVRTAQATAPAFAPAAEWPTIIEICHQLQGLPLAIQMAASAVRTYSCRQIANALREQLDFLSATALNTPERHRTLRAVFEHSWVLLTPAEQQLLQQLSIFANGFTVTAAAELAGATPTSLGALADKSLIHRSQAQQFAEQTEGESSSLEPRYRLHPLIRHFAAEKLADHPSHQQRLGERHSHHFCQLLAEQGKRLSTAHAARAIHQLRAEHENIRAGWQWAANNQQLDLLSQATPGLTAYYLSQGPVAELQQALQHAVAGVRPLAAKMGDALQAKAMAVLGLLLSRLAEAYNEQGAYAEAAQAAQEAIQLAQSGRHADVEGMSFLQWGRALFFRGQYEEAQKKLSAALTIALSVRNTALAAAGHTSLGANRLYRGDYVAGSDHFEEALRIYQTLGDEGNILKMRYNMALLLFYSGDFLSARAVFADCLEQYHQRNDQRAAGLLLNNLGAVHTQLGDYEQARRHYEEALANKRALGDRPSESLILANLGLLACYRLDYEAAAAYCRDALQISQTLEERAIMAFAQTCLGHALVGLGWLAEAAEVFGEAVALRKELGQRDPMLEPLAGLAGVFLAMEQPAQAQTYVEQILPHMQNITAAGIIEPFRIYWTCYRVLEANRDLRATEVLTVAQAALLARAAKITDDTLRRHYLEQIATHRAIMAAHAQLPIERRTESSNRWRQRVEEHADLVEDLEKLLHPHHEPEDAPRDAPKDKPANKPEDRPIDDAASPAHPSPPNPPGDA